MSLAVHFHAWFVVQLKQDCWNGASESLSWAIRSNSAGNAAVTLLSQHLCAHLISKLFAHWSAKAPWKMDCECSCVCVTDPVSFA